MVKAMRAMWRMKRKAEQKQLNRLAFGVLRTLWAESPWQVITLLALRSVVSWLVIWGLLFACLGWILLCSWLSSFGAFYDALSTIGREEFITQSQQFASFLGGSGCIQTGLLALFFGAISMWSKCVNVARREQRDRGLQKQASSLAGGDNDDKTTH